MTQRPRAGLPIRSIVILLLATLLVSTIAHQSNSAVLPFAHMATIQSRAGIAASGTPALFAAQIVKNEVIILDAKGSQIGSFKPVIGPLGNLGPLATDMAGNVYVVPLNGYGNTIDIYAPPYSGKPTIVRINAANQIVIGVAVDARTGVFAIMSVGCLPGACGDDRVTFFRHGETKPCNFLFEPRRANGLGTVGSFDRSGTLFVMTSLLYSQRSAIASFSGECEGGQSQLERFPDSPSQFGTEVAFNADDNLVVQARTTEPAQSIPTRTPRADFSVLRLPSRSCSSAARTGRSFRRCRATAGICGRAPSHPSWASTIIPPVERRSSTIR